MKLVPALLCVTLVLSACGRSDRSDRGGVTGVVSRAMASAGAALGGGLCGMPALKGEKVGEVDHPRDGCGIEQAVRITRIGDVTLSQPALIDCPTARALKGWLDNGAGPAIGRRGGGLAELRVAAHYACRTRNHQPGARISEHGKGRAIDISGFVLRDGSVLTVQEGWPARRDGRILRNMHAAACGPFGTVLGPDSDRFHQDHFHFDTARHRGGAYCR